MSTSNMRCRVVLILAGCLFAMLRVPAGGLSELVDRSDVIVVAECHTRPEKVAGDVPREVLLPRDDKTVEVTIAHSTLSRLYPLKGTPPAAIDLLVFDSEEYLIPFGRPILDMPCLLFLRRDKQSGYTFTDLFGSQIPLRYFKVPEKSVPPVEFAQAELFRTMQVGNLAEKLEAFSYAERYGILPALPDLVTLWHANKNALGVRALILLYRQDKAAYANEILQVLLGKDQVFTREDRSWLAREASRYRLDIGLGEDTIRLLVASETPDIVTLGCEACLGSEELTDNTKIDILFATLDHKEQEVRAYAITKISQMAQKNFGFSSFKQVREDPVLLASSIANAREWRKNGAELPKRRPPKKRTTQPN